MHVHASLTMFAQAALGGVLAIAVCAGAQAAPKVTVSDYESMVALLEQVDLLHKSFQESRRETWQLGAVEVVIDEWPHLNPFIEIEGNSEAEVKDVAKKLGFDWNDAVFGSVTEAYRHQYPNGNSKEVVNVARIAFDEPLPVLITGVEPHGS